MPADARWFWHDQCKLLESAQGEVDPDSPRGEAMDFEVSDRGKLVAEQVRRFMDETIYPAKW